MNIFNWLLELGSPRRDEIGEFLFAAANTQAKTIEVLRVGTFIDRHGREVTISEKDLDDFVAAFSAGAAGQDVPIDINHERKEAGGWIKRVWRDGTKLLAEPEWNDLGRQLVGDKVYRYLSATIDMGKRVIKSISLVNFPAVKGLAPVELGEGLYHLADGVAGTVKISQFLSASMHKIFTNIADDLLLSGFLSTEERKALSSAIGDVLEGFESKLGEAGNRLVRAPRLFIPPPMMDGEFSDPPGQRPDQLSEQEDQMTQEEREKLKQQLRQEIEAEMASKQKTEAELREQLRQELRTEYENRYAHRQALMEFANEVTGGEAGLSAKPEDIVEFLEALPDERLEAAKALLKAKVVDFTEHGSNGNGQEQKKKLPEHARADVLSGEVTVAELFQFQAVPGKPEDYDLSEFSAEQKG